MLVYLTKKNDRRTAGYSEKEVIPFKAGENVMACVLIKVGKPHRGSGKHKGPSHDFCKKARFKLLKDQIATNRSSEGTYFVSCKTYEHLFSILILG